MDRVGGCGPTSLQSEEWNGLGGTGLDAFAVTGTTSILGLLLIPIHSNIR